MLPFGDFLMLVVFAVVLLFGLTFFLLSYLMHDHYGEVKWTRRERRRVCYWIMPFGAFYVLAYQLSLPGLIWFLLWVLHLVTMFCAMWPIHQEHRKLQESTD